MKKIEITLYSFDELSEEIQNKVLDNLSDINVSHNWWEFTYDDAKRIGLRITGFDLDRNRHATGELVWDASEVAEAILKEHGESCDTYKLAKNYLESLKENEENAEEISDEFEKDLLREYSKILQNECDYLMSEEAIIETIKANDYTFEENGKMRNA